MVGGKCENFRTDDLIRRFVHFSLLQLATIALARWQRWRSIQEGSSINNLLGWAVIQESIFRRHRVGLQSLSMCESGSNCTQFRRTLFRHLDDAAAFLEIVYS